MLIRVLTVRKSFPKKYAIAFLYEPRHEKTCFLHYAKTKAQISCAVTAQLISDEDGTISLLSKSQISSL